MIHYKPHITVYNELNSMSYNELNAMSSWPVFIKCVSCDKNKREKYILECSHCEREVVNVKNVVVYFQMQIINQTLLYVRIVKLR